MGNTMPWQKKARILMLGLDDSGKTTLLYKLKFRYVVETISTIGFNTEVVNYKGRDFEILDFGGHKKIRWLWYRFCHDVKAIIFVIDADDHKRMPEVKELLSRLVDTPELRHVCLLFYINTRTAGTAMTVNQIITELALHEIVDREWSIFPVNAVASEMDELYNGFDWLWKRVDKKRN